MFSDVLLTVDYDRTLTAPDSTIPQRNLDAIHWFMENGGTFTVNTGRSIAMARQVMDLVPVNAPFLLYNGSAAYDPVAGELSQTMVIPLDPKEFARTLLEKFPMMNLEQQGVRAHYLFRNNPMWERYNAHNGCAWAYETVETMEQPLVKMALQGEFRDESIAQMYEATAEETALFDEACRWLEENYGEYIEVFRACARTIDIHAKGVNKLNSARCLQKTLGKKILICVGDGENDLAMLEGADYAWCPADGVVADRFPNVCKCADGAVADVIYEKIPGIL